MFPEGLTFGPPFLRYFSLSPIEREWEDYIEIQTGETCAGKVNNLTKAVQAIGPYYDVVQSMKNQWVQREIQS